MYKRQDITKLRNAPNITLEPEGDGVRIRGWGQSGHAAMPEGTVTVSYTHLDVYKRQELSSLLRTKREPEMVLAPVRGAERFYVKWNCSILMSKENQKSTSDFDALDPRERGCSPLSDPEGVVEAQKC